MALTADAYQELVSQYTPLYGGYYADKQGNYGVFNQGNFIKSTPEAEAWLTKVSENANAGPTADSAYLTALRSLGYDQATAMRIAARRAGQVQREMGLSVDDIKAQGDISRRNISGGAEMRGAYRSGSHLRSLAEQRATEGRQIGRVRLAGAGTLGENQSTLEQTLSDIARQRAEQTINLSLRREQKALLGQM